MQFGLEEADIQKICKVLAMFPEIDKAIIYGSRAKGNYRKSSDIDLTLVGKELNLTILNQISQQIDALLLPYLFDLSIFHQITNTDLVEHINRVGQVFYKKTK
jgi:predicted nucleotidyltransferase